MDAAFRYDSLPVFEAFERLNDPGVYAPLPDDWHVGVADVVRSTDALRRGRYKDVNMAGAAVVAAVKNALGGEHFPFVFGGDGAVLAVPDEAAGATGAAMAACAVFAERELRLTLRVGMLQVAAIRAAGHDLRVARYAASREAVYAMFSGGGASFAEAELKDGRLALPPAPPEARPDLAGLSCRWSPIAARHGLILSLLVLPAAGAAPEDFRRVAGEVVAMTQAQERAGHPVPAEGPAFALRPRALRLEAAATRRPGESRIARLARIAGEMGLAIAFDRAGRTLGRFDPRRYRRLVTANSDFRKFEDGLRMTIDCGPPLAEALEALLAVAEAARLVDYGLHRQESALMTCIVPSALQDDHLHFLDGAGGGYAMAAQVLKSRLAARQAPAGRAA